ADLFKTAGADRIMTVDLHTAQIQGLSEYPVDHLFAQSLLAAHVRETYAGADLAVVSPDAGRVRLAEQWARDLDDCPIAIIHKTRDPLRPHQHDTHRVVGEVRGRVCVLVDDMIDTGSTVVEAVEALRAAGAAEVVVAATHGVLSDRAATRLTGCGAREIIVTNTLPIPEHERFPGLTVLSVAPLLARAIREVFEDGSVTGLFPEPR
ncbi:ribose-phosphate diphosphokinase, partial [Solihabitans fulvus]